MANEFERIAAYLRDEGCPRTPQEIADWTGISLNKVYETLRDNSAFFREIIKGDILIGWTTDYNI